LPKRFGERLQEGFDAHGQLCVGIDPHTALLNSWGLEDSVKGLREFGLRVVDAAHGRVSLIKPQVSFFERFGAKGFEVLAEVTNTASQAGLLVIADAKRGDIGTTMDAYLEAWFGSQSGLYADALTVSPYLGLGTYVTNFSGYAAQGKGLFSLVATSNPEGASVQLARSQDTTLAGSQWSQLDALNAEAEGLGDFGAVLGATLELDRFEVRPLGLKTPVLAPGFGAQGAELVEAKRIYGSLASQVAYSVSRSVLQAGPADLARAISESNAQLSEGLSK
jgi:orotidine-5'-phosphate decarboxylase